MRRREFLGVLGGAAATWPLAASAQGTTKVARVGWLTAQRETSLTPFLAALRAAFVDLGYVEGRNLVMEYRFGDDDLDRVPARQYDWPDIHGRRVQRQAPRTLARYNSESAPCRDSRQSGASWRTS